MVRTALTEALAPVAPLLDWPLPLDISGLGTTLRQAVDEALRRIALPLNAITGTASLSYGTPMIPDADPTNDLSWRIPVVLLPGTTLATASQDLSGAADEWLRTAVPEPLAGRTWSITLTVPSGIDEGSPQPLLSYGSLVFRIG